MAARVTIGLVSERSGESDGYVVAAAIKAMGDECVDGLGYGHHVCAGIAEVQLGHWLVVASVNCKLRGLVGEEPDSLDTVWQRDRGDRVLTLVEQLGILQDCDRSGRGLSCVLPMLSDDLCATYDLGAGPRAGVIRVYFRIGTGVAAPGCRGR